MQMPDIEVFKEIPGYKAILKAVLKTQIQTLVEQLSQQTGEETVIVTASLEDGSLTHLGSDFGKVFLDSHDEIKSQFLGFCLKRNQMLQKTQVPPASTVRKKGPFSRRPRLAPYSTAATSISSRKVPRKGVPRSLQNQRASQYNQHYAQNMEPAYCQSTGDADYKQGSSEEMNDVIKTEPGLGNSLAVDGDPAGESQIFMENMSSAFPSNSFHGDEDVSHMKVKTEGLPGTHSIIGAENQSGNEGGLGQMKIKIEQVNDQSTSATSNNGQGLDTKLHGHFKSPKNVRISQKGRKIQMVTGWDDADLETSRPYPCNQCPKRFKERHHLTYHLRTHSGHRPYVCDVCTKGFTQSSSLNTHKKIHLNEINCGICGANFRKKSDFDLHVCLEVSAEVYNKSITGQSEINQSPERSEVGTNNQSPERSEAGKNNQSAKRSEINEIVLQDDLELYLGN